MNKKYFNLVWLDSYWVINNEYQKLLFLCLTSHPKNDGVIIYDCCLYDANRWEPDWVDTSKMTIQITLLLSCLDIPKIYGLRITAWCKYGTIRRETTIDLLLPKFDIPYINGIITTAWN